MASCGGLATRLPARCTQPAGPIDNRPQDAILPHNKIVAAREKTKI
jgi:hypothetical protein